MNNPLLQRFPGVIGFPVTPFNDDDRLDEAAFRSNLDFMAGHGFAALCCCGSNGEMPSLTLEEYGRVAAIGAEATKGKMGLILGVGQTLHTAQAMSRIARQAGAEGILLVAPYSNDLSDEGLADYYRRVAGAAEIPVALYQTKWSGLISLKLFDLLSDVENIAMVKDENGSISHYVNVRERFGDRYYWINGMAEPFVPAYWNFGVQTYTSGLACFMPEQTMQIGLHARSGDFAALSKMLDEIVTPLYQIRNRRPGYKCSMIKTAMTLCGLQGGRVRAPLIEMQPEDRRDLEVLLEKIGLLKPASASR
jgi:5-dehydro-4-deoxyglucarate dehydratase